MPKDDADLTGVRLLNRYELRRRAGEGGMADVYETWDYARAARVALKVLRRDLAQNAHFLNLFAQEAETLSKVEHPNIVRFFEFKRDGRLAFFVLEWVDGMNLSQTIRQNQRILTLEEVSHILQPVCSALNYAHSEYKVYHCDVKPANILLSTTGEVKIADFGVARRANEETGGGTPPYMAPEQFEEGVVDARTDVYALGITLYETLSGGYTPFRGDTPSSQGSTVRERIAWEHRFQPLPPLRQFNPAASEAIEGVIAAALDKNPGKRFATPLLLWEAFEQARQRSRRVDYASAVHEEWPTLSGAPVTQPGGKAPHAPLQPPPVPRPAPLPLPRLQPQSNAHLLGRAGEWAGQVIPLPSTGLTIGRSSQNRLQLHDMAISRNHTSILATRQGFVIRDEGSALGTFLNNQPVTAPARLHTGDVIRIGRQHIFEFRER